VADDLGDVTRRFDRHGQAATRDRPVAGKIKVIQPGTSFFTGERAMRFFPGSHPCTLPFQFPV